jgi:hypothetical protein
VKLEQFPIILGVIVFLIAVAIAYDSMSPEAGRPFRERRRRQRAELNRTGELFVALGAASFAAALVGREYWRWGTIAMFVAIALLIVGGALNRDFLREVLLFRGASRRAADDENAPKVVEKSATLGAPSRTSRSPSRAAAAPFIPRSYTPPAVRSR